MVSLGKKAFAKTASDNPAPQKALKSNRKPSSIFGEQIDQSAQIRLCRRLGTVAP
jgi:hypothetical protein